MYSHNLFWCRNANFRRIDSFKKIIFKKAVTAKLMVNIQEPVCSFIDTAFSKHHGENLFTLFHPQFGRSFNCPNFQGAEMYVAIKSTS